MRSDSNFISSRLYAKLEDSKYRTRSLTTLLSCESYETYDTHDTISRILEDVNLTPVQKTMRILRLTDEDVAEARARIKKRVAHKKLTEKSDECFEENDRIDLTLYYSMDSDYEKEISSMLKTKNEVFGGDSISVGLHLEYFLAIEWHEKCLKKKLLNACFFFKTDKFFLTRFLYL